MCQSHTHSAFTFFVETPLGKLVTNKVELMRVLTAPAATANLITNFTDSHVNERHCRPLLAEVFASFDFCSDPRSASAFRFMILLSTYWTNLGTMSGSAQKHRIQKYSNSTTNEYHATFKFKSKTMIILTTIHNQIIAQDPSSISGDPTTLLQSKLCRRCSKFA